MIVYNPYKNYIRFEVDPMNKQEAIEKIKNMETSNIISQIDEPQKVVIPQFVADWIDWCKRCHWDLQKTLSRLDDNRKVSDWIMIGIWRIMRMTTWFLRRLNFSLVLG